MHAHLSQGRVLSWNDNLDSAQAKKSRIYLACPPYLEMKGQSQFEALHASHLLDQCFAFCGLWTGEPWDKCVILFTSCLAHHKQDPSCRDANLWLPRWWLQNRDWQTSRGLGHRYSFSESWLSWTAQLQTSIVPNSQDHQTCRSHVSGHYYWPDDT